MSDMHSIFSPISPAMYAEASIVARLSTQNLISRLELVTLKPQIILDVGCGTGFGSELLKKHYPEAQVIGVDNLEKMLRHEVQNRENSICADVLSLPFHNQTVDFIFANFLMPWCPPWERLFKEWRRVLKPEGLLVFTCLGLDTLKELAPFEKDILILKDMHEIGDLLVKAKFSDPVIDKENIKLSYRDSEKRLFELQMSGMISSEIKSLNTEVEVPVTYEIIYGHAWGPNASIEHNADENGIVEIPLSFLRRRKF